MQEPTQQQTTTRKVISKSAMRKMNGQKHEDDNRPKKANRYTEMVVYHTKLPNGKLLSRTRHEICY